MIKLLKWFFMLSKRLYKKVSFVALLILIPVCVLAFSFVAKQDSGFVNIVLAQKNSNDKISSEVIKELLNENSIINFTLASSAESAVSSVKNGIADEAWVFPENTDADIKNFVSGGKDYVVSVFTKEQNVSLRLSREKLTAVLYKYCAKAYYIDYIRTNISALDNVSDSQLNTYFQEVKVDEDLFTFGNTAKLSKTESANYLTSPIRGLLAVLAVICAMAATMYYMQDEAAGTFSYVKQNRKGITALGCVCVAVINVSAVLLLSLLLSSLAGNIFKEILILVLYTLCCASFCLLVSRIFTTIRTYSALIPLFTVVFIGICPVFFDFRSLMALQLLLPPTYYVNAVFDNRYLLYMVIYTVICLGLSFCLQSLKTLFRNIRK